MDIEQQMRAFYDRELPQRATRPIGDRRLAAVTAFAARTSGTVLEVGCGGGRDGIVLRDAGLEYVGVDFSPVGVAGCAAAGLAAVVGSATALPIATYAVDTVWTMSTLMHLSDDGFVSALDELRRVVRPGGVVELGVWGSSHPHVEFDEHGRRFNLRTDGDLRAHLDRCGRLVDFATWDWADSGFHYQWARVELG